MKRQSFWIPLLCVIALALAMLSLPIYVLKVAAKHDYTDFFVYYRAAVHAKATEWSQIYSLKDGASPFRYAPPSLLLFRPLAELTLEKAQIVWFFCQYLFFSLGFWFLYRTLKRIGLYPLNRFGILCASFLFIFRLCLDTLTIGQISSLLFLCFGIALEAWTAEKSFLTSLSLFLPSFFKIGPGLLYFLPLTRGRKISTVAIPITLLVVLALVLEWFFKTSHWGWSFSLWRDWFQIVLQDSLYYDASHYGSQSLKSTLLRLSQTGWISIPLAISLHVKLTLIICTAIALFWSLRRPRTPIARALFFCLGIFPYIWFMPETFKYSLTPLAFPVALLLICGQRHHSPLDFTRLSLLVGFLFISVWGLDVVGTPLFFGAQRLSLPFWATVLLGIACFREAWWASEPVFELKQGLGPWPELPELNRDVAVSVILPLPLDDHTRLDPDLIVTVLGDLKGLLDRISSGRSEFLIAPYGDRCELSSEFLHRLIVRSRNNVHALSALEKSVLLDPPKIDGRAAALREGFLVATGSRILTIHAEQPCQADFYESALSHLALGYDLVRANRRNSETQFHIPVKLLSIIYGRHRLGLAFNRFVRLILPVKTRDTHSGTLAMSREFANQVFALQTFPGFLFDLEIDLVATAQDFRVLELPVVLKLSEEKQKTQMWRETLNILFGLPILASRYRHGCYQGPLPQDRIKQLTADDWGLSQGVNSGILELARLHIVHRVSIMANTAQVSEGLPELKAVPGIKLGIHFNLTYGPTPGFRAFFKKWINPFSNRKGLKEWVRAELLSQLNALEKAGVRPTYLDGHHHIHVIPGVLEAIADILIQKGITEIRLPCDSRLLFTKKLSILVFSWLARPVFRRHGFRASRFYYPPQSAFSDHGQFRAALSSAGGAEIVVHPASLADVAMLPIPDSYSAERVTEFRSLKMLGAVGLAGGTV